MKRLFIIMTAFAFVAAAQATIIPNDPGTGYVQKRISTGVFGVNSHSPRVWYANFNGDYHRAAIFAFVLPDLGGEAIGSANFRGFLDNNTLTSDFSGDLYGLRTSSSVSILTTDWYGGALDGAHTRIMDNFVSAGTAEGNVDTDATADSVLVSWLQDQYTGGAVAGEYVFFRINMDTTTPSAGVEARFDDGTTGDATHGALTITTVPEPASVVLVGMAGLALFLVRRRRNR